MKTLSSLRNPQSLFLFVVLFSLLSLHSCKDDKGDDLIPEEVLVINNFIHDNMTFAYYWNDKMPNLDPNKQPDSKEYFDALLYKSIDRWSIITDDLDGLLEYFSGVRKSAGYSYRLYKLSDQSDELVAFIEYVNPNTPASEAGLKRTDMFFEIDNTKLTTENYTDLLAKESFTLTLGNLNNDLTITPLSPKISLSTKELTINPIFYHDIIEHAGKKIGYLVYNSFISDYDYELQQVFSDFKSGGVEDLIVDLRYNSGGSINTAVLMASMIAPASEVGSVLLNNSFNVGLTEYLKQHYPNDNSIFVDTLRSNSNNLNLSRYVALTSFKTASASEMVIYTLMPYMDVIQIGEQTHGKYYGSITLYDEEKKHNWALQPIVMRAENSNNSINYAEGLMPDIELNEKYKYPLGDPREKFLAEALFKLTGEWPTGVTALKSKEQTIYNHGFIEESINSKLKYNMYKEIGK